MSIKYSFIILTYNNWKRTKVCLDTLIESVTAIAHGDIEILLIDNGSTDETYVEINHYIENNGIDYFSLEENMGYCFGMNYGLSLAKGEVMVLLNNDLIFTKGWFENMIQQLYVKDVGLLAPLLSFCEGKQNLGAHFNDIHQVHQFAETIFDNKGSITEVDRVIGACMLIKREVVELVGGLDYWFGLGHYDDDDYCYRVKEKGYKIAIVNNSFVYHIGSDTFKKLGDIQQSLVYCNSHKFFRKRNYVQEFPNRYTFIPMQLKEYKSDRIEENEKRTLFVADWSFAYSKWNEAFIDLVSKEERGEVFVWIPSMYYDVMKIQQQLEEVNNTLSSSNIKYIYESVYPEDILTFLSTFSHIKVIEFDFVNKYMVYLSTYLKEFKRI